MQLRRAAADVPTRPRKAPRGGPETVGTQRLMVATAALAAALAASLHAAAAAPPHVISVIVDECVPTPKAAARPG